MFVVGNYVAPFWIVHLPYGLVRQQLSRFMKSLIMFDFDGVIADSLDYFHEGLAAACETVGVASLRDRETFLSVFDGNMMEGLERVGLAREKVPVALDALKSSLGKSFHGVTYFQGMVETLQELVRETDVYVITSNLTGVVEESLKNNGIVGVREVLGCDKEPSKIIKIRAIIQKHPGFQPFYVGDTRGDMMEGREAGARTIGAGWGWHGARRLQKSSPDFIAQSPHELVQILRKA